MRVKTLEEKVILLRICFASKKLVSLNGHLESLLYMRNLAAAVRLLD